MTKQQKKKQARIEKNRRKRRRRGRPARDPAPPERRPRARAPRTRDERTRGYAGMPCSEWTDWRQVAETFVAERPHANDEQTVAVLVLCLGGLRSWGDFLAGRWLLIVGTEIYVAYVEGYSFRRGYQLLDRLVRWMHGRGDLTDWQHDVLRTEIDEARSAHGAPRKRASRTVEMVVSGRSRDEIIAEFAASLDDPTSRRVASPMLLAVDEAMRDRLGGARDLPLGSLDPEPFVVEWLDARGPDEDARFAPAALRMLARFYRWLGETGRLDAERARLIAWRLDSCRVALAA